MTVKAKLGISRVQYKAGRLEHMHEDNVRRSLSIRVPLHLSLSLSVSFCRYDMSTILANPHCTASLSLSLFCWYTRTPGLASRVRTLISTASSLAGLSLSPLLYWTRKIRWLECRPPTSAQPSRLLLPL